MRYIKYKGYLIEENPKPIPSRQFDWDYHHEDYDGPEDKRCGSGPSLDAVKQMIDEEIMEAEDGVAC